MNAGTFLVLAERASTDADAGAVLADALEECGFWSGAVLPGPPEALSLARARSEGDYIVNRALLRVDPRRAFEALSDLEAEPVSADQIIHLLLDAVEELALGEGHPIDPRWRAVLERLQLRGVLRSDDLDSLLEGLDWLDGVRPARLPLVELGEWEDFGPPLLFVGIGDTYEVDPLPGLVRASHQWAGHACRNTDLLGFFVRPPAASVDMLAARLVEMNDIAWITELDASDRALFDRASAPLGLPPVAGGGEAFVWMNDVVRFDGLRGLPRIRFRAAARPWEEVWRCAEPVEDGTFGDAEIEALAEMQRRARERPFVAWLWGNSD